MIKKVLSNRIAIGWKYSSKELKNANVTGFQVLYKPIDEQNYYIERVNVKDDLETNEQFDLALVNLKRNTKYLIKVKSYNNQGFSEDSDEIECLTLRGNVPSAPFITDHQVYSKGNYLIVKWEHKNQIKNQVLNAALRHEELNSNTEHQNQLVPKTSNDENSNLLDTENNSEVQFFMAYVEVSDLKMIVQTIPIPSTFHQITITNLEKDVQVRNSY